MRSRSSTGLYTGAAQYKSMTRSIGGRTLEQKVTIGAESTQQDIRLSNRRIHSKLRSRCARLWHDYLNLTHAGEPARTA